MLDWLKQRARAVRRDAYAIYLASRDPRVPWYAKAVAVCVAAYVFSPIDLIPDFVPVLGQLDELIVVPLGIMLVARLIPPDVMAEHRVRAAEVAERPISKAGAAAIIAIWVVVVSLTAWLAYRHFAN